MADLEWFTFKGKSVIYTSAFVKLFNWRNGRQVYKIYGMIELKKMCTSIAENLRNLSAHRIIEISLVLRSIYMVPKN